MTKYFKNPERGKTTPFQSYVPRYQLMGITPTPAATGEIAVHKSFAETELSNRNIPFAARVLPKAADPKLIAGKDILRRSNNVPYAEAVEMTSNIVRSVPLPNVGNNIENTWSGMDDMVMDEEGEFTEVDANHLMIDNNFDDEKNYVGIPQTIKGAPKLQIQMDQMIHEEDTVTVFDAAQLNVAYNEYVLAVKGEIISTGLLDQIQEEVRELVFGEHSVSEGNIVSTDDIIVLKRIKIKVGVFIE